MTTSTAQSTIHIDFSYFALPLPRPYANNDCTPGIGVSPGTVILPSGGFRPQHGSSHIRLQSDRDPIHSEIKVQTTEGGKQSHHEDDVTSLERVSLIEQAQPYDDLVHELPGTRFDPAGSSISASVNRLSQELRDRALNGSRSSDTNESNSHSPLHKPKPGYERSRSHPAGIWYEKRTAQPPSPFPSSKAASMPRIRPPSLRTTSSASSAAPRPLRPPARDSDSGPVYKHTIRMESFTKPIQVEQHAKTELSRSDPPSRRRSSWARGIFVTPITFAKRIKITSVARPQLSRQASEKAAKVTGLEFMSHSTQLRRNRTKDALQRVTSILHQITSSDIPSQSSSIDVRKRSSWSMSNESATSRASEERKHPRMVQGISGFSAMYKKKSMEAIKPPSETSSIRDVKMGHEPHTTPEEKATYKIKRSPSAETEVFLKVDISIYGGTSYLPSEARRIHTPPFRDDGIDGQRRGFFFDYNAPSLENDKKVEAPKLKKPAFCQPQAEAMPSGPLKIASKATTIDRSLLRSNISRYKTGDWYETQLAAFDTSIDDAESSLIEAQSLARRSIADPRCERALNEKVDQNVAEHYPTSTLCPRHVRYWRVVHGKMISENGEERSRVCWMHG